MSFKKKIENKRVLLLGPAPHILKKENTNDYEDFDIIVKINKMVENIVFDNQGLNKRNDVLYHCLDINLSTGDLPYSVDTWLERKVLHLRISPPPITNYFVKNINRFVHLNKDRIENSIVDDQEYIDLMKKCGGTLPNTGTTAINDLLTQGPKELHIRGITFFCGGYAKNYKKIYNKEEDILDLYNKKSSHNVNNQINYFEKLYKENEDILFIDKELQNVIEKNKNNNSS
jgi:hypothetical protein